MARREVTGRKPGARTVVGNHSQCAPDDDEQSEEEDEQAKEDGPPPRRHYVAARRVAVADADAYSLAEFCQRHRISLQLYYKLKQQGLAPRTFFVGTRVLVSKEAAADWRREREAASAAA